MKLTFDLDIGLNLKYQRLINGYSLRDLSQALDTSHTLISKLEMSRIGLSEPLQNKYETFFKLSFDSDESKRTFLNRVLEKFMNALVRYNESALIECVYLLNKEKMAFQGTLYHTYFDMLFMVSKIHTVRGVIEDESIWLEMLPYLPSHLKYLVLLGLTHAHYLNYRFKEALIHLKALEKEPMEEVYKALIYEKISAIMFFQFNRQEALALNEKAYQIFSSEDIIVRMSLCEIRKELFKTSAKNIQSKIDYQGAISKAVQFKIYFMTDTIHFIKGLRYLHNENYDGFLESFNQIENKYASSDLYYGLGLWIMGDYEALKKVLRHKSDLIPPLFKKGFIALESSVNGLLDEKAFKQYLKKALEEKSYEDTMLSKKILEDYYLKHRKYKDVFYLLTNISDVILKP